MKSWSPTEGQGSNQEIPAVGLQVELGDMCSRFRSAIKNFNVTFATYNDAFRGRRTGGA